VEDHRSALGRTQHRIRIEDAALDEPHAVAAAREVLAETVAEVIDDGDVSAERIKRLDKVRADEARAARDAHAHAAVRGTVQFEPPPSGTCHVRPSLRRQGAKPA